MNISISLIAALSKHNIYYIKETNISYFISVPKVNNTNITIEIKNNLDKYDFSKNDTLWVKENAIAYYKEIDDINNCYVLPIFSDNALKILGDTNINNYLQVENIIIYLINSVNALLVKNNISPYKQVVLIKNDEFLTFINYFMTKYKNRISCITLLELLQSNNIKLGNYKKIESGDMNFVVGSYNEPLTVTAPKEEVVFKEEEKNNSKKEPALASSGYVGYYLLGFISILVTLFILYLVI